MALKSYRVRLIQPDDDAVVEDIIRTVLVEFGADRPGFAWQDPELSQLSKAYAADNCAYWVVESNNVVVGGCGIAPLKPEVKGVCELQKMYIASSARGNGFGRLMVRQALEFASRYYRWCYLETLKSMTTAQAMYRSFGFINLPKALIETEHDGCDAWLLRELDEQ